MDKFGQYLKWDVFATTVAEKRLPYFSLYDAARLFPAQAAGIHKVLSRKVGEGKLIRLKRNLYCLPNHLPNEYLLANILYQPSYISLEFALAHYGLIPETVYSITSVTTKPTRQFTATNRTFAYHTIRQRAYTGYVPIWKDSQTVLIATREKALADYLYFVYKKRRRINERLSWKNVNKDEVERILHDLFKTSFSL
ncbi:hypothetical protein HY411_02360 [Candidatus Gottesmanbacteria bacterium]|nr:hypothetical protein [Candidatus Gottesmanbacteria bacterium]